MLDIEMAAVLCGALTVGGDNVGIYRAVTHCMALRRCEDTHGDNKGKHHCYQETTDFIK